MLYFPIPADPIFASKPNQKPYYVRENDENVILPCSFAVHVIFCCIFSFHLKIKFRKWVFSIFQAPSAMWVAFVNEKPQLISLGTETRQPESYELDTSSCPGCYNLKIRKIRFDLHNGRFFCQLNDSTSAMAHVVVLGEFLWFCSVFDIIKTFLGLSSNFIIYEIYLKN